MTKAIAGQRGRLGRLSESPSYPICDSCAQRCHRQASRRTYVEESGHNTNYRPPVVVGSNLSKFASRSNHHNRQRNSCSDRYAGSRTDQFSGRDSQLLAAKHNWQTRSSARIFVRFLVRSRSGGNLSRAMRRVLRAAACAHGIFDYCGTGRQISGVAAAAIKAGR